MERVLCTNIITDSDKKDTDSLYSYFPYQYINVQILSVGKQTIMIYWLGLDW